MAQSPASSMTRPATLNNINCQVPPKAKDAGTMTQSPLHQMTTSMSMPESPATLTNFTVCHSIKSDVSLAKDPEFWRRFSAAIHQDEEQAKEPEQKQKQSESWLSRQHKKTRRSKLCGLLIAFVIVLIACGAGIAIWLLSRNDWMRANNTQKIQT